jgi:hypothetical protein
MSPHFNPIISLTRSPVEAARKTIVWNGSCNSANCRKNFPPCSRPGPRTTLTKKWFSPKRKPFSVEASSSSAQPRTGRSFRAIPGSSFRR